MDEVEKLEKERDRLKMRINQRLDLLVGHIRQSPAMKNPSLTMKKNGKTVTRYVRKRVLEKARRMTENHLRIRELIQELSEVNWQLLSLEGRD